MTDEHLIAGVELGGTKAIAVLARGRTILDSIKVPTTSPTETLGALSHRIAAWNGSEAISALGVASFGPIGVDSSRPDYGRMLATPKVGWSGVDVLAGLSAHLDCPSAIDTDVNAAALAEHRWGAGQGLNSFCYLTIGTGVGGAVLIDGSPVHGALHPEIGHLRLRRAEADPFGGVCPFHHDCIEGLVSGPALEARFGGKPTQVNDDDPRWSPVVHDFVELVCSIVLTTSAQRILIGGGVGMGRPFLLQHVRDGVVERLRPYLAHMTPAYVETLIAQPDLGDDAGPLGAIVLGLDALTAGRSHDHQTDLSTPSTPSAKYWKSQHGA